MTWIQIKPYLYIAGTLALTLGGMAGAKTTEKRAGDARARAAEVRCQEAQNVAGAKIDSLSRIVEIQRIREEVRAEARAERSRTTHVAAASSVRACSCLEPAQKPRSGISRIVVPALSFVAGVVVGHSWEREAAGTVVNVISSASSSSGGAGGRGHGGDHHPKPRPKPKPGCRKG